MPNGPSENQPHADTRAADRQRVESEVVFRLRSRGVHLTGRESDEELVELLEAVERFEKVVERQGGDLMVDEPVDSQAAREPDDRRFVLPPRRDRESVAAYIVRIAKATDLADG